ncbi:MAG TPA: LamG-like jellyroll fold domain-containing protein, partial [Armatimonadota bacterium]|nr:LamG-like jellyroll fold domain-containing protein [Armatimonadota bacterium]
WGKYYATIKVNPIANDNTGCTISFSVQNAAGATITVQGKTKVKYDGSTWYYVVGSARNTDKVRLYVKGVEDGPAQDMDTLFTPDPAGAAVFVTRTAGRGDGLPWFIGQVGNIGFYDKQLEP